MLRTGNDTAGIDASARRGPAATIAAHRFELLWTGAFLGLAVHLAGVGVDVYLHSNDETLAAREGVLTLSNPGHALLFAGIALMAASILGALVAWLGDRGWAASGARRAVLGFAALPLLGAAAAGAVWLVSAERDSVHDHGAAAAHPGDTQVAATTGAQPADHHSTPGTAGAAGATAATTGTASADAMAASNAHFHHAEVAATEDQLRAALAFVDAVKADTAKFKDVSAALADGYIQITQDYPGIAAHFARLDYITDGNELDSTRPEILLYTKRLTGDWQFIGVMFSSETTTETAPSYFGSLDSWHYHENLCFQAGAITTAVESEAKCRGVFTPRTAWELHVWTVPGATGPFSHDLATIQPGPFPPATRPAALDLAAKPR